MSQAIKNTIDANIKTNGNQQITGAVLNGVLKGMVDDADNQINGKEAKNHYKAGQNVTFSTNADGSVNINAQGGESTAKELPWGAKGKFIVGRAIPLNAIPGSHYYFADGYVKFRKPMSQKDAQGQRTTKQTTHIGHIVTIPEDFATTFGVYYRDGVYNPVYEGLDELGCIVSLSEDYNNFNASTTSPNFMIQGGKVRCVKRNIAGTLIGSQPRGAADVEAFLKAIFPKGYKFACRRHYKEAYFSDGLQRRKARYALVKNCTKMNPVYVIPIGRHGKKSGDIKRVVVYRGKPSQGNRSGKFKMVVI